MFFITLLLPLCLLVLTLLHWLARPAKPTPVDAERQRCLKLAMEELDEQDRLMGILPPKPSDPAEMMMRYRSLETKMYGASPVKYGAMTPRGELAMAMRRRTVSTGIK